MGWGIDFKTDIYLSKQSYSSIYDVEDTIEDMQQDIDEATKILLMLAATNDLSSIIENDEDVLFSIKQRVNEAVITIIEAKDQIVKLELYVEYLKELEEN